MVCSQYTATYIMNIYRKFLNYIIQGYVPHKTVSLEPVHHSIIHCNAIRIRVFTHTTCGELPRFSILHHSLYAQNELPLNFQGNSRNPTAPWKENPQQYMLIADGEWKCKRAFRCREIFGCVGYIVTRELGQIKGWPWPIHKTSKIGNSYSIDLMSFLHYARNNSKSI